MLQESKDVIIKNFVILMKECNVDILKDILINKGVFSANEISNIFSSSDARHNKRLFFFNIQKKEQRAYNILIESLKITNQHNIADILVPGRSGCKPFRQDQETNRDITPAEGLSIYVNPSKEPLDIKVVVSSEFYDTAGHNKEVDFYSSRSRKRGKLLIINNFDYKDNNTHKNRNGATVDNNNLQKLFNQMGGWEIQHHNNKTAQEMSSIVKQFAQDSNGIEYDVCFVIIMGHGGELLNETIIYGVDSNYVFVNDIQKEFTNKRCIAYKGKPKVFLFQVCRGDHLDHTIRPTETDSVFRESVNSIPIGPSEKMPVIRTQDDMLIGYATLNGYKAHRDPYRGSWYIELVCEKFMKYAHNHTVDDLLNLVDQGLRSRMSDRETMQTAEHLNKGFKKLYLNPGIYYENGELKKFH